LTVDEELILSTRRCRQTQKSSDRRKEGVGIPIKGSDQRMAVSAIGSSSGHQRMCPRGNTVGQAAVSRNDTSSRLISYPVNAFSDGY